MKNKLRLSFSKYDIIIIAAALLIALAIFLITLPKESGDTLYAEISQNGTVIASLPLDTNTEFEVNGSYTNIIKIENSEAYFFFSDCPSEDCVHSGKLSKSGQLAVCLPNAVSLRIVGGNADIDAIAG